MKIMVLSDTHMPVRANTYPDIVMDYLKKADAIIHAGDIETLAVYNDLKNSTNQIYAVYGNCDEPSLKQTLKRKLIVEIGGIKIGIIHGDGYFSSTELRALDAFSNDEVDIIVFGHSHVPVNKQINKVFLFNPGSACDKRLQKQYSFGIITIENHRFSLEHIFFDHKK